MANTFWDSGWFSVSGLAYGTVDHMMGAQPTTIEALFRHGEGGDEGDGWRVDTFYTGSSSEYSYGGLVSHINAWRLRWYTGKYVGYCPYHGWVQSGQYRVLAQLRVTGEP